MKLTRTKMITKIIILSTIGYLAVMLMVMSGKVQENEALRDQLADQLAEMQQTNRDMDFALENKDDPTVQERVARDNGYLYRDEKVFVDIAD